MSKKKAKLIIRKLERTIKDINVYIHKDKTIFIENYYDHFLEIERFIFKNKRLILEVTEGGVLILKKKNKRVSWKKDEAQTILVKVNRNKYNILKRELELKGMSFTYWLNKKIDKS